MNLATILAGLRQFRDQWGDTIYVVAATVFTWQVMRWAEHYAEAALAAKADLMGAAGVIGAVSGVAGAVQAFAFKHHLDSKGEP